MYYELYMDSLFVLNFAMNLFVLLLVNRSLMNTASCLRLLVCAMLGALLALLPFYLGGIHIWRELPVRGKMIAGVLAEIIPMTILTFRIRSIGAFWQVLWKIVVTTFCLGGGLLAARRVLLELGSYYIDLKTVLGVGALLAWGMAYEEERRQSGHSKCLVTLVNGKAWVLVSGIWDTGNGLVEPISGKPVSVIQRKTFEALYGEAGELYRVIPYQSIGRHRGILKGYLLPEMRIEINGITKICRQTYVAVCEEEIDTPSEDGVVRMILNPQLLQGDKC